MSSYYANITLHGPGHRDVVAFLNRTGQIAYVAPGAKAGTVVFHEDFGGQEQLAAALSAEFRCPALLVMVFGESVLLYHLYVNGDQADAYVSSPHEGLELDGPAPAGDAAVLCAAFGVEMPHLVRRVERTLNTPTRTTGDYAYAANRHGELARALGLPLLAAGAGYSSIELGELPDAPEFDPKNLQKTGTA
jgi:hypothetical protein